MYISNNSFIVAASRYLYSCLSLGDSWKWEKKWDIRNSTCVHLWCNKVLQLLLLRIQELATWRPNGYHVMGLRSQLGWESITTGFEIAIQTRLSVCLTANDEKIYNNESQSNQSLPLMKILTPSNLDHQSRRLSLLDKLFREWHDALHNHSQTLNKLFFLWMRCRSFLFGRRK